MTDFGEQSMEEGFRKFLKKGGRSDRAVERVVTYVDGFKNYLKERCNKELNEANAEDLEAFIAWIEQEPDTSAKRHLWGIGYYYEYISNEEMRHLAGAMREERIERRPFPLGEFRGIHPEDVEKLSAVGIRNVDEMLEAGKNEQGRAALTEQTGVAGNVVLELVKLSDLARIPGVKGIRARLYFGAGVDTLEKMAEWEPEALRKMVAAFVEQTGFEGVAPLLAEVRYTIERARRLPKILEC